MRAPIVSRESASVYRSARHPGPAHNDERMAKQSRQVKTVRAVSALGFCQDQGHGRAERPSERLAADVRRPGAATLAL